jgi:hypothetical protein
MMDDAMNTVASASAGIVTRPGIGEEMQVKGRYTVECRDAEGNLKWSDEFNNLVTTVGKNAMLDQYLAGSSWSTGTVYMGMKGTGSAAASDTMSSHAGWTELNISASSGARQSMSFSAASSGSKVTSAAASFSITAAGPTTVAGVFVVVGGTATNANTTGTLFSAGDFASSRSVVTGDSLNVTYTVSV